MAFPASRRRQPAQRGLGFSLRSKNVRYLFIGALACLGLMLLMLPSLMLYQNRPGVYDHAGDSGWDTSDAQRQQQLTDKATATAAKGGAARSTISINLDARGLRQQHAARAQHTTVALPRDSVPALEHPVWWAGPFRSGSGTTPGVRDAWW